MKKKFLAVLIAAFALVFVLALSCSALDFQARQTVTMVVSQRPTSDEAAKIVDTMQKQVQMGMIGRGKVLTLIHTEPSGSGYKLCALVGLSQAVGSIRDNGNGTYTLNFPANYTYEWDSNSGFYEISSTSSRTIAKEDILYMNFYHDYDVGIPYTGVNPNYAYGNGNYQATTVNDYFNAIYNAVVNHEQNMEAARQDGYEIGLDDGYDAGYTVGFQDGSDEGYDAGYNNGLLQGTTDGFAQGYNQGKIKGKEECESTHLTLQEQAYDDGYDMGQEECAKTHNTIRQAGYDNGLYDCEQTHEAMKREQYEEGWNEGHATGVNDGYDTGYDEGYETGYDEGYDAHAGANEIELKKQYDDGYSEGKEVGYTEALNSGDVVIKYVDGLFSAPIDFLYGAFNIEILGVNLFNLFMLLLSILIVGGVLLLVFKFR